MSVPTTEHSPSTVTGLTDEACPGCGATTGVQRITGTSPKVRAWSCTACGMGWAISVVNPHLRSGYLADLGAAAQEIGRLRWMLRQVIALADEAPTITDQQLRHRLLALAQCTLSRSNAAHRSPAGRWSSEAPDSAPGGQPVPDPADLPAGSDHGRSLVTGARGVRGE